VIGAGRRYAATAAGIAAVAAVVLMPWVWGRWPGAGPWALAGWAAAAVVGVGTGAWLARAHGRPGSGFLAALVTGMLIRLVLVGVGLVVALRVGDGPAWGFLSGFAIAFVPLQGYEVVWSLRANRVGPDASPASRGGRGG